jgi:glyoxylase-like metal-dependent hydrolase (beta-lactamase superfamily II)
MSIRAEFTFDRAGQGLFYHGNINFSVNRKRRTFTMVYDCGTLSGKKNLSNLVDRYHEHMENNSRIGLLAISHFDYDHVSHIPELLSRCRVDAVMLPHIAEELRLVLLAKSIFDSRGGGDGDEINQQEGLNENLVFLFQNPVEYFTERANHIIEIHGDNDDFNDNYSEDKPYEEFKPHENDKDNLEPLSLQYIGGGGQVRHEEKQLLQRCDRYCGSPVFRVETNKNS